ncbi:helix-turn-helix domain-containing protein [Neolewinella xylanilytica]|uniref:helix-turn-helix domain-containing protein n=1 Tax=Neolewinella xylanilytica TaxID=1514080 RepID=UPI00147408A6|nr:helix-turn-helix domain-containing protein [Neolewinella xylanilytica]
MSLRIVPFLLFRLPIGTAYPELRWLPLYFWHSSLPLLYLYIRTLTGQLSWRRDWRHLLPGAAEFLLVSAVFLVEYTRSGPLWDPETAERVFSVYTVIGIVPNLLYAWLVIRLLNRSQLGIKQYYSDLSGKNLTWLKISVILISALAASYSFLRFGPIAVEWDTVTIFGAVLNTLSIYYVSINGLRQFALADTIHLQEPVTLPPDISRTNTDGDQPHLFETVDRHVRGQKPYLDPQLTIANLSEALRISERNLSRIINSGSGQHFNRYINRYRVEHAKRLLLDEAYDHYNMEGIAAESGFNNKATFYQAFKRYSKLSPGTLRKVRDSRSGLN